jgi:LacI family transcriptional regulator
MQSIAHCQGGTIRALVRSNSRIFRTDMTRPPPHPTFRPATLQTIADAAGVHRSTAARALDPAHCHRISPDVVERVRMEASRQGYRRDAIAASLRTGRTRLVGAVLPDLANPVFAPILAGVTAALARGGYSVLVAEADNADEDRVRLVQELIARRVDGLILATARRADPVVTACLAAGVPTVLVNRAEDRLRAPSVVSDDEGGMRLAVDHLVGLGHRRIGHLAGPADLSTGLLRRQGFEAAMVAAGLDPSGVAVAAAYGRPAGQAAARELFDRFPGLTAIAAANDLLALGAYEELARCGKSCPADISIVGHNDMPLVDMVHPPLTTVRIEHGVMGEEAARLLLARIADPEATPIIHMTPAAMVVRQSTARIPTRIG